MKTTLDLPDEIVKNARASAAGRGETLRDYVAAAIESRLRREGGKRGWRSVYGAVRRSEVAAIDRIVTRDLEKIEPDDWQ